MREWRGYGVRLVQKGSGHVSYYHFYETPWPEFLNSEIGGEPLPLVFTEDPEGDHYGFLEADGDGFPCMVQGHEGIFSMQFPYGYKKAVESGDGVVVRMSPREVTQH